MSNKSIATIATMGIDIGKNSFHVVGLDRRGAIVLRRIYACLVESAADWEWVIEAYGPGSISLRLDESLKDEIVRDAFLSVLRDVRTKLESFGEWVPLQFLNGLVMFSLLAKTRPKEQV